QGGGLPAESCLAGADDGLGAVGNLKSGEDVGDVVADGFGAEDQFVADLGVVAGGGDEVEDLVLALGELGAASPGGVDPGSIRQTGSRYGSYPQAGGPVVAAAGWGDDAGPVGAV